MLSAHVAIDHEPSPTGTVRAHARFALLAHPKDAVITRHERALAAALALSTACTTTTQGTRRASLLLVSDPPGAEVTRVDDSGEVSLGRTPVVADLPYTVVNRQFDRSCWVWPAYFGLGVVLGGFMGAVALASGPGARGSGAAALGAVTLLGVGGPLALGTGIYCGVSAVREGEEVQQQAYDLWIRAPGRQPVKVHHVAPEDGVLELHLTPREGP
jgi:hypothetical protein